MAKKLRVSFHSVDMQNNQESFADLLDKLSNMSYGERKVEGINIIIDDVSFEPRINVWFGLITKVRMGMLPEKYDISTGEHGNLSLGDQEGLAEMTAFLYDPTKKAILLQKSQYGPSENALTEYLQGLFGVLPVAILPILNQNALDRLASYREIKYFDVKFARLREDVTVHNATVNGLLSALNPLGYGSVSLVVKAERGRGLARQAIDIVRTFFRIDGEVQKIEIKGDDDKPLDLLKWKLVDSCDLLSSEASSRTLDFRIRKNALDTVYRRNKDYLYSILP